MPIVEVGSHRFKIGHCRPAENEKEREKQQEQVQKGLSGYLTGGTKKVPGITGKEKVAFILRRLKALRIKGRKKLVRNLGAKRVRRAEFEAKADFVRKWLSLGKALEVRVPVRDLKKLPEVIRKELDISVAESELVRVVKGIRRWKQPDGTLVWKDSKGRFSKRPVGRRRR